MRLIPRFGRKGPSPEPSDTQLAVIQLPVGIQNAIYTSYYVKRQTPSDIRQARFYSQNDGYGAAINELIVDQAIGPGGIVVDLGVKELNNLLANWAWNLGRQSLRHDELQRQILRGVIRDGESLLQVVGNSQSINIHVVDPLDLPIDTALRAPEPGVGGTVNGIEYDARGRPVFYHFRPDPQQVSRPTYTLAARHVIHSYRQELPGQLRGISWLRPALDTMKDLAKFEKDFGTMMDVLVKQPGFLTIPRTLERASVVGETAADMIKNTMVAGPEKRNLLPEGVQWIPTSIPDALNGDGYRQVRRGFLARVARAVGISYFSLSGDLEQANFSSLRQGHIENAALYERSQKIIIEALHRVIEVWLEWNGIKSRDISTELPEGYPKYFPPRGIYLDPAKDAKAQETQIANKTRSRTELIRESGRDPDTVFKLIEDEEERFRKAAPAPEEPEDDPEDDEDDNNGKDQDGDQDDSQDDEDDEEKDE